MSAGRFFFALMCTGYILVAIVFEERDLLAALGDDYRRWRELEGDVPAVQRELFDPLSIANWTTMIGYSGMVFANHPGIRSIGIFACVGLLCIWITTLFLLPGMLTLVAGVKSRAGS